MTKTQHSSGWQAFVLPISLIVCALFANGCALTSIVPTGLVPTFGIGESKTPQLSVKPVGGGAPMLQKFSRGYLGLNDNGEYEIVLVTEGARRQAQHSDVPYPGNAVGGGLRQIVHIRVLWKPLPGTRADQPTATNATVTWHVRSGTPNANEGRIDYDGAGFVAVYPDKGGASVVVRNATLALREQRGELVDPLGRPDLSGSFKVERNDGMVRDILASLNPQVASR